jgi:hypothetical protein
MMGKRFAAGMILMGVCSAVAAQEPGISLPANSGQWLNSAPISLDAMKGKGAVLYFFEEG